MLNVPSYSWRFPDQARYDRALRTHVRTSCRLRNPVSPPPSPRWRTAILGLWHRMVLDIHRDLSTQENAPDRDPNSPAATALPGDLTCVLAIPN